MFYRGPVYIPGLMVNRKMMGKFTSNTIWRKIRAISAVWKILL
jgi:hypothetical protein